MQIFNLIRELADLKGIKMPVVAEATGVSVNTMKNWNKSDPSAIALLSVAQYFDVSVDYLLGHSDNPFSHKNSDGGLFQSLIQELEQLSHTTEEVQKIMGELIAPKNNNGL